MRFRLTFSIKLLRFQDVSSPKIFFPKKKSFLERKGSFVATVGRRFCVLARATQHMLSEAFVAAVVLCRSRVFRPDCRVSRLV